MRRCRRCRVPFPDDGEALCAECHNVVVEQQLAAARHRQPEPEAVWPSWVVCLRCGGLRGRHASDCQAGRAA